MWCPGDGHLSQETGQHSGQGAQALVPGSPFAAYVTLGKLLNHSEPQFFHLYNRDNQHCPLPRRLMWVCTENTYAMQNTWSRTSLNRPQLCSSPPCPPPWVPGTLGGLRVLRKQSPGFGYSKSSSRYHQPLPEFPLWISHQSTPESSEQCGS